MQEVKKVAVFNSGAFRLKFRVKVVDSGISSDWSDTFLLSKHETINLDRLGVSAGAKIRVEIDVTPIHEGGGGTERSESDDIVVYLPNTECVATYAAKGTLAKRELILID
jgi:hypothetical protein